LKFHSLPPKIVRIRAKSVSDVATYYQRLISGLHWDPRCADEISVIARPT